MAPEGELLGATNYLPPEEFGSLLVRLHLLYQEKKDEIRAGRNTSAETSSSTTAAVTRGHPNDSSLSAVTNMIMELADRVNGGYGRGQKFIHPEANDFLLSRYETTKDTGYLDHVCLTLDRMRAGEMHDQEEGGYFRTCSNADWSRPHREKLLGEQAGLLANCLRTFRITQQSEYALMAEDIIGYIDRKLSDSTNGAFYGCEDFLRNEAPAGQPRRRIFHDHRRLCLHRCQCAGHRRLFRSHRAFGKAKLQRARVEGTGFSLGPLPLPGRRNVSLLRWRGPRPGAAQ